MRQQSAELSVEDYDRQRERTQSVVLAPTETGVKNDHIISTSLEPHFVLTKIFFVVDQTVA